MVYRGFERVVGYEAMSATINCAMKRRDLRRIMIGCWNRSTGFLDKWACDF